MQESLSIAIQALILRYHTMKSRRIVIFFFVFVSSLIVLVAAAGLTLQYLFNGKVKDLFVRELNKQLATEVKVSDIRLSLFQDFPFASVRFSGVEVAGSSKLDAKAKLLSASLISMKFNIPDLLRNSFSVRYLSISGAAVNIHFFADGSDNFHILKPSTGKENEQFNLNIKRIELIDTKFSYTDEASQQTASVDISRLLLKGSFKNESFRMEATGSMLVDNYSSGEIVYIKNRGISLKSDIDVDTRKGYYSISDGEISIETLHLNAGGWVINRSGRKEMEIVVAASNTSANKVISLIPDKYRKSLVDYSISGTGDVGLKIKGRYGNGHKPAISAQITLASGEIIHRKTKVGLESVSFNGSFLAGEDGKGVNLNIDNLKAILRNGTIAGNISVTGLQFPVIKAAISGSFNLADVKEFLNSDTITQLSGKTSFTGTFSGRIANPGKLSASDFRNSQFMGSCSLSSVTLGLKGYKVPATGLSGILSFNNNDLLVSALSGKFGESDFLIKGSIGNLLSRIFVKGEKLVINGSLVSEKTNWDEISSSSEGTGEYNFGIPGDIEIGNLKMDIRNFHFRKFDAKNLTTEITVHNRVLTASNILLQSMQGTVTGKATINASNPSHSLLTCDADVNKVNVNSLFIEFGNFGNTDLVAENLDGRVTGNILFSGLMYPNLDMDLESIKSHAELVVEDGRLVNYEPMEALSKFLRVDDLKDIRFETLTNQIDIANQIIYIPVMEIKSSALNLTLMGTHTFDNELNYHFSIALADILASKFRKKNPGFDRQEEFGPIAEDNKGKTMIFVSMTGTVDEPVFSYDKKAVREKIGTEMQSQRSELKQVLNKELQWLGGDTLAKSKRLKEKEIQKKQEDGKFVIEWDDDEKK
jgi:hypothetical protein